MGDNLQKFGHGKLALALAAGIALSGCVSDTLSTVDTQPKPVAAENVSYDPEQRAQAIAEIREKAAQSGSGELTNAFVNQDGPSEPMSASEQAQLINQLEQNATQNQKSVTDAELEAKQRSILELQQKARTHYDNAVNDIQN
ncbi:MAG: hypothetical protein AAGA53_13740 [Pseudomonadota bacterium]